MEYFREISKGVCAKGVFGLGEAETSLGEAETGLGEAKGALESTPNLSRPRSGDSRGADTSQKTSTQLIVFCWGGSTPPDPPGGKKRNGGRPVRRPSDGRPTTVRQTRNNCQKLILTFLLPGRVIQVGS